MTICTFFGHREVLQSDIEARLDAEIERLLKTDNEFQFMTGGMGQYDNMAAKAVRAAKRRHPNKRITLVLVLPYMTNRLNTDKEYCKLYYDRVIIPEEADAAHYKAAIQIRNRWMADKADMVIAYVYRNFGGAFASIKYAEKRGKPVVNLAEKK